MSCYMIKVEQGRKVARPITTEKEYREQRNAKMQLDFLAMARNADLKEAERKRGKNSLLQFNYSGHYPNGLVKGNKLPSMAFGFDIDDREEFERVKELLLAEPKKYGLLMLERSVNQGGHAVFRREQGRTILENQVRIAIALHCEMDNNAHDLNRVYFTTSASAEDLLYLSPELFTDDYVEADVQAEAQLLEDRERFGQEELPEGAHKSNKHYCPWKSEKGTVKSEKFPTEVQSSQPASADYLGIPYSQIIQRWWQMYNDGQEPVTSNRDVLTFELAVNLRHICGFSAELLDKVIPCYDGFAEAEKMKCINSALAERRTQMPKRLRDVLDAIRKDLLKNPAEDNAELVSALDEAQQQDQLYYYDQLPKMAQGVSDSIEAAGRPLCMPTLIGIAPAIGALATGVKLDIHGQARGLNLISFIEGEASSGKGQLDAIIAAWMTELQAETDMYTQQEDEWAKKNNRTKSGKAPEQPKLPVRMLTLNNTVANIAERLANTDGKHSYSFTPEADNVALKWKQSVSDFSVMLRQAYDEARYDREAKSSEAVRVHIPKLLWNVTMCGTCDALYRVVTNYTDGLLSRICIARTPDNTWTPLAEQYAHLTENQSENIQQIAHLLPLMQGTVELPKLESHGREWLETIRVEAMKNDDRVMARQRFRGCINAQRLTCALWLPKVCEQLIRKHGMSGAETRLKQNPELWIDMLRRMQNDEMMRLFDLISDYLIDNVMFFFRSRIESAYEGKNYNAGIIASRSRQGKNDTIFSRLSQDFSLEQALQQSIAVKGATVSRNSIRQMLKNWKNQGLIVTTPEGRYHKMS